MTLRKDAEFYRSLSGGSGVVVVLVEGGWWGGGGGGSWTPTIHTSESEQFRAVVEQLCRSQATLALDV